MEIKYSGKEKHMCKLKIVSLCQFHDLVGETENNSTFKCYPKAMDPSLHFYELPNRIPQTHGNKI